MRFAVVRFAVERFAAERAAVARFAVPRVAPVFLAVDRAAVFRVPRAAVVFRAPLVLRAPVALRAAGLRAVVLRAAGLRAAGLRAAGLRAAVLRAPVALPRAAVVRLAVPRLAVPRAPARLLPPASFAIVSSVASSIEAAVFFRILLPIRVAVPAARAATRLTPVVLLRDVAGLRAVVLRAPVDRAEVFFAVVREPVDLRVFAIAIVLLSEKLNFAPQRLHQLSNYIVTCAQVQSLHSYFYSKV